jgi:hypothetical protein
MQFVRDFFHESFCNTLFIFCIVATRHILPLDRVTYLSPGIAHRQGDVVNPIKQRRPTARPAIASSSTAATSAAIIINLGNISILGSIINGENTKGGSDVATRHILPLGR